jgi:hypothetical protein
VSAPRLFLLIVFVVREAVGRRRRRDIVDSVRIGGSVIEIIDGVDPAS